MSEELFGQFGLYQDGLFAHGSNLSKLSCVNSTRGHFVVFVMQVNTQTD